VPVPRFFAPSFDVGDDTVRLPKDEAEHLTRVLRLGPGDSVAVFDGRGHEFLAKVVAAERREVRLQLVSRIEPAVEAAVPLTLVQAVLKGEKTDEIVRDAVMMGIAAIQPVITARSETTVAALSRAGRVDRWRRVALASVKQSRRAVLPDVKGPLTFDSWLEEPMPEVTLMLVEPAEGAQAEPLSAMRDQRLPSEAALVVGPEGGWAKTELARARERGARLITMGHRTLRADAVAVAAISVLQFLWGDL
jgi:16S rRNA (uracil1498-N3)-methyltransferase